MKLKLHLSLEQPQIEKPLWKQLNKKAKARKDEASKATKPGEAHMTSIRANGGGSDGPATKKDRLLCIANGASRWWALQKLEHHTVLQDW